MATAHAIYSVRKAFAVVAFLISLTTACKKSGLGGADVDPRDQYVGIYDGGYTSTTFINSTLPANAPEAGKVEVTVSKTQTVNQLYVELLFNGTTKQMLTVELTDATFRVIDKQTEPLTFGGKTYNAAYTAQGQFVVKDKVFTLNTVAETLQQGVTLTKRGDITGTRK